MKKRLFLDRIDAKSAGAAVGREDQPIAFARAHETKPALAVLQAALARTDVALDASVGESMKISSRVMHGVILAIS
jgi:hypothetical protein